MPMDGSALSLRDLQYVVAVSEERHFGRAAKRCNVSQPALSAQIQKLEAMLGVDLFERTSRRVFVTRHGEVVARQAQVVLSEARRLLELVRGNEDTLAGPLSLAAIQTLGPYYFPRILRPVRQRFPDLSLILSEGLTADLLASLRDGRIDVALISPPVDEAGLTLVPLFYEPFLLACPAEHALAREPVVSAARLIGPELLLLEEGHCLRDQAMAVCGSPAIVGRHATSLETLRSMVAAGNGYTLLPVLATTDRESVAGLAVYRRLEHASFGRTISLAYRTSDPRGGAFGQLASLLRDSAPGGVRSLQ